MENVVATEIPITLKLPFLGLRRCGLFTKNALKRYFIMTLSAFCLGNLFIIAMVQFTNIKKGVVDVVRNLEGIFSFVQILGKISVTTYYINDFTRLMELTKLFWRPNMCNQRTETNLNSMYRTIFQLQKLFLLVLFMAGSLLMLVPLLERIPALGIWTLEGHETLYDFVIVQQLIMIPCSGVFLWSLD
ncbi:hypothetical protein ILUMI_19886, partial [Ignelater luminosus]